MTTPAAPPVDYAQARGNMVDSQVRPNKVVDPRVVRAMRHLPREAFVPAAARALAYADAEVDLGGGRSMLQPMVIARLVQICAVTENERVLVVGAATGYGAALLSACGATVIALEEDQGLAAAARSVLASVDPKVTVQTGRLADGWPQGAPYDVILIEGAVRGIPASLAGQLRPGTGRVVAVMTGVGASAHAVVAEATPAGLHPQPIFDCSARLLAPLLPPPAFVF